MHANLSMKICTTHKLAQNAHKSHNGKDIKQFLSKCAGIYDFLKRNSWELRPYIFFLHRLCDFRWTQTSRPFKFLSINTFISWNSLIFFIVSIILCSFILWSTVRYMYIFIFIRFDQILMHYLQDYMKYT